MIFVYIVFCVLIFLLGRLFFKNTFNPICLYTLVWMVAVSVHESGLIEYYELNLFTWIVIFVSHLFFVLGNVVEKLFIFEKETPSLVDFDLQQIYVRRVSTICLVVSGCAIVANLKMLMDSYGFDLFSKMMVIYQDRLQNDLQIEAVPYLSSLLYVALPLLGIRMKKKGFSFDVLIGLLLVCANSLTSGGRAGIIFSLLLFFAGYKSVKSNDSLALLASKRKKKIAIVVVVSALFLMIGAVSQQRAAGIGMDYATDFYKDVFGENVPLYKGIVYIASPVAVLNEYLKVCEFRFGKNTFVTLYNVLYKFGMSAKVDAYQSYYNVPMSCNVGTWVREIIEDFSLPGSIFVVVLFGFLSSFFYYRAVNRPFVVNKIIWSVFALVIVLSFFDWKFRTSNLWIAVFCGSFMGCYIDKKSRVGID